MQWNPVNVVTNGSKKLGCINGVVKLTRVFLQENVWRFLPGSQKKWNPVNVVTNGQKKLGRINGVVVLTMVFFKKTYGGSCQAAKKSGTPLM